MNPQLNFMLQQALQAFQSNHFDRADSILKKILQAESKNLPALHILGLIKASQGKYKEAAELLSKAARINPNDASIQYNLAKALADSGANKESIPHHKKATELAPSNLDAWLNYGKSLSQLAQHEEALHTFESAIAINPRFAEAWSNKGNSLHQLKQYKEAIECFDKALGLKSDYAEASSNKGNSLHQLKQYKEAIECFDKALSLKPDYAEAWLNKGNALSELMLYEEAIECFDKALSLKPDYAEAWSNKGNALNPLRQYKEAIACFDRALNLNADIAETWSNKANALSELMHYEEAITHHDKALKLNPHFSKAWSNKANILSMLKRYLEAINHYEKALDLDPDADWGLGSIAHLKMKICAWKNFSENIDKLQNKVRSYQKISHPFNLLSLVDDCSLHKQSAEIFAQELYPADQTLGAIPKIPKHAKIRIGYFSADFRHHPVSMLTAELFELHDKSQFEIIAFSYGPDDKSPLRSRISRSFNQFIDINDMSDLEATKLARELQIDIAVDLGGFTLFNRTGIFALRTAPIQISYIGYLGTMGTQYMDYILADETIIPEESKKFYSEKIIHLPSYQVNDSHRKIADKVFTREELGIPRDSFVFTCFNNNYKILPAIFESWMRILNAVDGSVLFLFADNEWSQANLIKEAEAKGIDSQRLIFGKHLPTDEYLARYQVCDLFLDTSPYNAGTTASDALWAGLPVLTLMGNSFASRMAASLLKAIGLPELITTSQSAYEVMAIELANHPHQLAEIKQKLVQNRDSTLLFDTPLFTKNLESAYSTIYQRYQADLTPDDIAIN